MRFCERDITGMPARLVARLGLARSFQHARLVARHERHRQCRDRCPFARARGPVSRAHAARPRGRGKAQARGARASSSASGLANDAERPALSLALGRQRIVEIARALSSDPVLLLLDEPAAGLRHQEKAALAALLRKLADEGVAILLVEHDMDFVMGLCERVIVMNFGSKLAEGAPAAIARDPAVIEAYLGAVA